MLRLHRVTPSAEVWAEDVALMRAAGINLVAINIFGLDIEDMYHMLMSAGVAGLIFSVIALALVLAATPAPSQLSDIASERRKYLEEHLPEAFRSLRTALQFSTENGVPPRGVTR